MSSARAILEAESPKRFLQARQSAQLSSWLKTKFSHRGDKFALLRPFTCAPELELRGRFWAYLMHGEPFGPWEFSCVLLWAGAGMLFSRQVMKIYPLEPVQSQIRTVLDDLVNEIESAASNPLEAGPNEDSRHQRYWLERTVADAFARARQAYEKIESENQNLWAI